MTTRTIAAEPLDGAAAISEVTGAAADASATVSGEQFAADPRRWLDLADKGWSVTVVTGRSHIVLSVGHR